MLSPSPGEKTDQMTDSSQDPPWHDKPSIAVLPFDNMSGDPEQEYFSDGITEDIITELSRFSSLFVIARNSSFTFKGEAVNVTEVGEKLGVAYVVEGSVRKAGNRVRITANSSKRQPATMSGPSATTAISRTSSRSRTKWCGRSPRRFPANSTWLRCNGSSADRSRT